MKTIKAVVGILRKKDQFMDGFWGLHVGKIEAGESKEQAIIRELKKELGIQISQLSLHQTMMHQYEDRTVQLSIYNINEYRNTPLGIEGQAISWVGINELNDYKLLPTVKTFIDSITLPDKYWITPSTDHQSDRWTEKFNKKLTQDITLIQLRSKTKLDNDFILQLYNKCKQNNIKLLLNTVNKTFNKPYCDGWHITTAEMLKLSKRPCSDNKLLGASTHNLAEALKAQAMGANFVVISPVQVTKTHPDTLPLGWDKAKEVVDKLNIPVYFLGGMALKDLEKTVKLGAQGIAGVSAV